MVSVQRLCLLAGFALLLTSIGEAQAEEGTIRAMAPWEGSGQIFATGPKTRILLGSFSGILYVDKGEGTLDTALMLCPAIQRLALEQGKMEADGHCVISRGGKDLIYADWNCEGRPGECTGEMKITGGAGKFKGISGGGKMLIRAALAETARNLRDGDIVRNAMGLAVWPELKYVIPAQ